MQAVLDDPSTILYTELEMPRAYQSWSGPVRGIHDAYYNVSANRSEQLRERQPRVSLDAAPAGTHRTRNVSSFRFVRLPAATTDACCPSFGFARS